MVKKNLIDVNGLTIVENYNKVFEQISKAKTADEIRDTISTVKQFIAIYKKADKSLVGRLNTKLQSKIADMLQENDFMYERINKRVEEVRNYAYDYTVEKDDTQAVQKQTLQLIAQMPTNLTDNHMNAVNKLLNATLNSGVVGCKAVLELLKYPAYAGAVSGRIREKAYEGSKTPEQQAFERAKEAELKNAEQALATVYMKGFHLRNMAKQVDAFNQPSNWGDIETA